MKLYATKMTDKQSPYDSIDPDIERINKRSKEVRKTTTHKMNRKKTITS